MGNLTPTLPAANGAVRRPPTLPLPGAPNHPRDLSRGRSPASPDGLPAFGDLLGALLEAVLPLTGGALRCIAPARPQPAPDRAPDTDTSPVESPAPSRRSSPDRAENHSRAEEDDAAPPADDPTGPADRGPASLAVAAPPATGADSGAPVETSVPLPQGDKAPAAEPLFAKLPAQTNTAEPADGASPEAPAPSPPTGNAQGQAAPAEGTAADPTTSAPSPTAVAASSPTASEAPVQETAHRQPTAPTLDNLVVESLQAAPAPSDAPPPSDAPTSHAQAAAALAAVPPVAPAEGSTLAGSPRDGGSGGNPNPTPGREPAVAAMDRAAGPSASARPARAERANPSALIDRIVRATQLCRANGPSRIRLVLQPPELGTLRLTLSVKEQTVSARVMAETTGARALIGGNLVALREALEQHGLQLGSFQVSVSQQGHDAPAFDAPSRGFLHASRDARRAASETAAAEPVPRARLWLGPHRINLVA